MKQKEFVIRPKHLITGLLVFITLAILGFAILPQTLSEVFSPKPAEIAAREGAQAFLSTDIEKGQADWEKNICKVASKEGCVLIKQTIAPMLWPSVERGQVRQSCQAIKARLITNTPAEGDKLHTQAWEVTLECTDINSGETSSGEITVLVSEHEQDWQFDLVLFAQENPNAEQK